MVDFSFLTRKKQVDADSIGQTQLARVLNTLDLTALGIGSTLGAGIYVLAGSVIKNVAGPSVVLSFIVAAIASVLAGLCYAEFGARVPKTGSAYVYTYVTVGEFMAFIIGWNLILEYIIGTSSVARAFSTYFDSLVDNKIQKFFREHFPMNITGLSQYPDLFAFAITLVITVLLASGVKESSRMNNIFTSVNLCIVTFIMIFGSIKANFHNWNIQPSELPINWTNQSNITCHTKETCGDGGFFPFGFSGMLAGAAKCFYAFVGFDCIATTGEEVKNPQRAIPLSIVMALLVCTIAYCGVSGVLSLMLPYFLIDQNAPLPEAFRYVGWNWARYLVAIGAICSLSTSLLGAMFPLPRVLYAIASDGLIFRQLAKVNRRFQTPLLSTILSGFFAGIMAMIFDLDELVNMMSIGTLLAYSLVAVSVLVLRYQADNFSKDRSLITNQYEYENEELLTESFVNRLLSPRSQTPTDSTSSIVSKLVALSFINIIALCVVLAFSGSYLTKPYIIALVVILGLIALLLGILIFRQPQNKKIITFKMPFLPILPLLSIFINTYLMLILNSATWIRFGVWMFIGFLIYFGYGIRNSSADPANFARYEQRTRLLSNSSSSSSDGSNGIRNPNYTN